MESELAHVGLVSNRHSGILPQPYMSQYPVMANRTPGAIGCYMAQMEVISKAFWRNQHAFVMEDDLVFCNDFYDRMVILDSFTKIEEWDILWLGGTFHVGPPYWHKDDLGRDAERTKFNRIMRTYGAFCTYAYIVNKESIVKVLEMLHEWMPKSIGIDWSMIQMQPKLKTFAFVPGCVKQYDNVSDQLLDKPVVTRFSKFEKLNGTKENSAYWFQEYMGMFDPDLFDWKEAAI